MAIMVAGASDRDGAIEAGPLNFLILGDGEEERAWARTLAEHPEHRLHAAFPGFEGFPDLPGRRDLDAALADEGIDAVIVGGDPGLRSEGLRRAAAAGFPALCLHPPGPDPDAYYQVSMSRQETGAIVVPDLPARLHPGVIAIREALASGVLGAPRGLRFEATVGPERSDLLGSAFPRAVDLARMLLGEVEALTASGDPPGDRPTGGLLVVLRGPEGRRAEVRLESATGSDLEVGPARLSASGERGTWTLDFDPGAVAPALLTRKPPPSGESEAIEVPPWDPREAILSAFRAAVVEGREVRPDLLDATRTIELAEAAARSLRRERTIELHYEELSEVGTFKGLMTSTGCFLLFGILIVVPVALLGPALGFPATIYLAYAIPPVLVLFLMLQVFRLALGRDRAPVAGATNSGTGAATGGEP